MTKSTVPESVRESWARIRVNAKAAVEEGARAVRLLVSPEMAGEDGAPGDLAGQERTPPANREAPPASCGPTDAAPSSRPPARRAAPCDVERRAYRRVQTPAFWRPAGLKPFLHLTNGEAGEARLRMYSDEPQTCGAHLKLELLFAGGDSRSFTAVVSWQDELEPDAPARFDVGLRVLDVDADTRRLIASVLAAQEA